MRQKLSAFESVRRSHLKDVWELPSYRFVVEYKQSDSSIDSILYRLDLEPSPEKGRVQPVLGPADWVSIFGLPAKSPTLREHLRPLNLAKRIDEGDEEDEVDFIFECGLELYFAKAKKLKLAKKPTVVKPTDFVFAAARFLRSRELDGRE